MPNNPQYTPTQDDLDEMFEAATINDVERLKAIWAHKGIDIDKQFKEVFGSGRIS